MLAGVTIKILNCFIDERGSFAEMMRTDWKNLFGDDKIAQANLSTSYPGIIRAWHRHAQGQVDYFVVLRGAMKICAFDDKTRELNEVVSTGQKPQIVRIPGYYWHGFKVVGNQQAMLLYFTTNLYNQAKPDEERRPWNDPKLIPTAINGKKEDPRAGKAWDWNSPPHR